MEDTKEKQAEINPLLFKLAIPIALSIVGIVISTLRKSRLGRKPSQEQMDYPESMTQCEFEDEEESSEEEEDDEFKEGDNEEEDDDDDDDDDDEEGEKPSTRTHLLDSVREQQCHEISSFEEQIEDVKSLVASIEDRQSVLEAQFYDYCNMKEQESAFQKLQIMCLGLKLDSLESQNQRLENTINELGGAMSQLDQIRDEINSLQRNIKKLARANNTHMIEKIARSEEEFVLATKEVKRVADQLLKEIKEIEHKLEIRASKQIEEGLAEDARRLENKKLFEHLQQLQDQWSADVEELIYIGWINASLRREILIIQEEEAKPMVDFGDVVVMELLDDREVKSCSVEFYNADFPSTSADIEDLCMDMDAKKCARGSKKPRLMQKLKGWAKGKGKCKRACDVLYG